MIDTYSLQEFCWRLSILVLGNILGGLAVHYIVNYKRR
jgi:hypothetical protein